MFPYMPASLEAFGIIDMSEFYGSVDSPMDVLTDAPEEVEEDIEEVTGGRIKPMSAESMLNLMRKKYDKTRSGSGLVRV